MNKREKEALKKAKEVAKAKLLESQKEGKNETGITRTHNPFLKKSLYLTWLKNKDKTPAQIMMFYPDSKLGTVSAWISAWKAGKNLPK